VLKKNEKNINPFNDKLVEQKFVNWSLGTD